MNELRDLVKAATDAAMESAGVDPIQVGEIAFHGNGKIVFRMYDVDPDVPGWYQDEDGFHRRDVESHWK